MNLSVYILRRFLYSIPILLGVCLIIFVLFNLVAGDPTHLLLGKHASAEQMHALRIELGLDQPWYIQYFDIVRSAFTFDFGRSWATKQRISEMIILGAGPSLAVTLPMFIITTIFAIGVSLLVSFYRGGLLDRAIVFFCVANMSVPILAVILFSQWYFAYYLGWFEISGYDYGFPYFLPYVLLPIWILVFRGIGTDIRVYRTFILDVIYQDFVRTARAKGLTEKVILFKHVLKNAMIPIITQVVLAIPFLVLGSLLIESFFSIPGLGGMTLNAINSNDFPVLKAMTVITAVGYIVFSIISDILYTIVDPRVRIG